MKYEPNYRFFCLPAELDIEDYMEVLQWGNDNLKANTEPPRDCRRPNFLREYDNENTKLHS